MDETWTERERSRADWARRFGRDERDSDPLLGPYRAEIRARKLAAQRDGVPDTATPRVPDDGNPDTATPREEAPPPQALADSTPADRYDDDGSIVGPVEPKAKRKRTTTSWSGKRRAFPTKIRKQILARDPMCVACRRRPSTIADHIVAVAFGGTDDIENGQGMCRSCHSVKTRAEQEEGRRRNPRPTQRRQPERHPGQRAPDAE